MQPSLPDIFRPALWGIIAYVVFRRGMGFGAKVSIKSARQMSTFIRRRTISACSIVFDPAITSLESKGLSYGGRLSSEMRTILSFQPCSRNPRAAATPACPVPTITIDRSVKRHLLEPV